MCQFLYLYISDQLILLVPFLVPGNGSEASVLTRCVFLYIRNEYYIQAVLTLKIVFSLL